jgi:hypothetical protein
VRGDCQGRGYEPSEADHLLNDSGLDSRGSHLGSFIVQLYELESNSSGMEENKSWKREVEAVVPPLSLNHERKHLWTGTNTLSNLSYPLSLSNRSQTPC